jgi:hypothetical protein
MARLELLANSSRPVYSIIVIGNAESGFFLSRWGLFKFWKQNLSVKHLLSIIILA